jgi:hypothetical protein
MRSTSFWDITPCNLSKVNRCFGGTYRLHLHGRQISQQETSMKALLTTCFHAGFLLAYFLTLKVEAICSSETSSDFQQTTRHYIPEDGTLHSCKIYQITKGTLWNRQIPKQCKIAIYKEYPISILAYCHALGDYDGYWIDNRIYYSSQPSTTESLRTPSALQFTIEYITTTMQSLYPPQPLFWHPLPTLSWLLPNSRFPSFLSWPPTHLTH